MNRHGGGDLGRMWKRGGDYTARGHFASLESITVELLPWKEVGNGYIPALPCCVRD